MGLQVVMGAVMKCSFGETPSSLIVVPEGTPVIAGTPCATILDAVPEENIPSFGMCNTISNPAVAAATAAKLGVFTPVACVPVTEAWIPGTPTVLIDGIPALSADSTCLCNWGGIITVEEPGQFQVLLPD
ncbi:MAG TPA: DUF4280 domain-containing protein [Acidimicrobiales bacterium]|jgi:hypothetical protein